MGADFLLTAVTVPPDATGAPAFGEHVVATLIARAAALDTDTLYGIADDYLPDLAGDDEYIDAETHALISRLITTWFNAPPGWRDTSLVTLHGHHYLMSGGMSWGDAPTESFNELAILERLNHLFEEPIT